MEYKTAQNKISELARYIKYLCFVVILLIVCNFSLSGLLWHQSGSEKTILIPANFDKESVVSNLGVDANYLLQCAMFFVESRLNVTPETVDASSKVILSHTASTYYANFNEALSNESIAIKKQKISSAFYMSDIKVNPKELVVFVTGTLKRWVGERSLDDTSKKYELHFDLHGSELFLTTFTEIKKEYSL